MKSLPFNHFTLSKQQKSQLRAILLQVDATSFLGYCTVEYLRRTSDIDQLVQDIREHAALNPACVSNVVGLAAMQLLKL